MTLPTLIFEWFDLDIGHYTCWNRGYLHLHGSWDWNKPIEATLGVKDAKFCGFVVLWLPPGTYEYKWRYTENAYFQAGVGMKQHEFWFNDCSGRVGVGPYHNQILHVNNTLEWIHITEDTLRYINRIGRVYYTNRHNKLNQAVCDRALAAIRRTKRRILHQCVTVLTTIDDITNKILNYVE